MNPFSTSKGTFVGLLMFVGFSSLLAASQLDDGVQQNNELQAAQLQLIEQEACPYPPQTPAADGAEGAQPEAMQPKLSRPPAPFARPAIYMELLIPSDGDNVLVTI